MIKLENTQHKYHSDTKFAKATIFKLEQVASILSPPEVTFHSQDDKCWVALGIPVASKQTPLIHADYKVKLPRAHKLIPSIIAVCNMTEDARTHSAVTYSGPTYVAIRSAKHQSSMALSHMEDMKRVREIEEFRDNLTTSSGLVKSVTIVTCDGGPNENPHYQKTISASIDYFCSFDLDTFFVASNAPGRSAYNWVERQMAPLSYDIAEVMLPHNHFGSHWDSQGNKVESSLEINFEHTGKVPVKNWSDTVIYSHPIVSEYISHAGHQAPLTDRVTSGTSST